MHRCVVCDDGSRAPARDDREEVSIARSGAASGDIGAELYTATEGRHSRGVEQETIARAFGRPDFEVRKYPGQHLLINHAESPRLTDA